MIGKKILNYKIESLIGEGGMGNVYLASHTTLDRKVAVKSILPQLVKNEEIKSRFLNEAKTMSKLQHPNIVGLYDYHSGEEGLFLFMEYVEGKELHDYLLDLGKPLDEDLAIAFMKQILSAFSHAHKKGIVHRDIKPSNIIISNDGEIKILDFGIAKILGEGGHNLTKTGAQIGTVYYMSPEQVEGKPVSHLSDIYSIGVTMYQLLTMVNPYKHFTTEFKIYKKITGEKLPDVTELNPLLNDSMNHIIHKATAKEPNNRFQSCKEFSDAFDSDFSRSIESAVIKENTETVVQHPDTRTAGKKSILPKIILSLIGLAILVTIIVKFSDSTNSNSDNENSNDSESPNTTETDGVDDPSPPPEEPEINQGVSAYQVSEIMSNYYNDLNNDDFNAHDYYAPRIDRFIAKTNISPSEINRLNQSKTDYLYASADIIDNYIENIGEKNSISYWTYWVDFTCWRTNREKWQHCKIHVEVGFNVNSKMVSYRELKVEELRFDDYRNSSNDNTNGDSYQTDSYLSRDGNLVFRDDCHMIFTGAFANEADCISWVDRKKNEGYTNPGYLWIPDYPSLSGKRNYATFMGPYSSSQECKTNLRSFPSDQRFYYCKKVSRNNGSSNPEMDEIRLN